MFPSPADYRAFLMLLREGMQRYAARLISYCLLSDHWHLVLESPGTNYLPGFTQWVTATHTIRWHRKHGSLEGPAIYQDRFDAEPLDEPDELMRVCRHVERNALRAGLVRRAEDWPWCSLADRLHAKALAPLVPAGFLASPAWIDYVNMPATPHEEAERRERRRTQSLEAVLPSSDDLTEDPGGLAGLPEEPQQAGGAGAGGDQDHADTHVERPHHLGVVELPLPLQPRKDGGHGPALTVK
jgi:putative transposase